VFIRLQRNPNRDILPPRAIEQAPNLRPCTYKFAMSAIPPSATEQRTFKNGRYGPLATAGKSLAFAMGVMAARV
jgi:hypothetical protein